MKFRTPHIFVLLVSMIIISAALTYLIPAGSFARVQDPATGRMVIDAQSFTYGEATPAGLFDIFMSIPLGMIDAAGIIFFVFIIGGSYGMVRTTGLMDAGMGRIMSRLEGRESLLLVAIMIITSLGGAAFGLTEELIPLVPLGVFLARRLRYDALVGMAIFMVAVRSGYASGAMNPFTVGFAQSIATLPLFSGSDFRWAIYVVMTTVTIWYVMRYAQRVKADPLGGLMHDLEEKEAEPGGQSTDTVLPYEPRHTRVIIVVVLGSAAFGYGVFQLGWFINELAALCLILGLAAGLAGGTGLNRLAEEFFTGAKELAPGALVIGIARGILIVLEQGQIIDTIIYSAASWLAVMPTMAAANGMFLFHLLFNFLIPSGSGQAATTVPLMVYIADMTDITRQTAVLAYNLGDGMTNQVFPTVGSLLAALSLARIPYERYFKFILPLVLVYALIGFVFVTLAVAINLN